MNILGYLSRISFGEPWWLLLMLVAFGWLWWRRRRRPAAILFSRVDLLAKGTSRGRWVARTLVAARLLGIMGVCLALSRPRAGARAEQVESDGISIILAIDISSSMLAEDFQPLNRLEVAKERVKDFIRGRTVDQVGIVAFSGEALTQVPLTVDYPVLLQAVDNLQPGQLEGARPPYRRRQQPRYRRPANGGERRSGARHSDVHHRRGQRGHGARAGRARRLWAPL
jgi:Ca-activated chloride channel family protein